MYTPAIFLGMVSILAGNGQPAAPTPQQLQQAKAAFEKLGGMVIEYADPGSMQKLPVFLTSGNANDTLLMKLPALPFPHGLGLDGSHITDAGLKDLARLKGLVY